MSYPQHKQRAREFLLRHNLIKRGELESHPCVDDLESLLENVFYDGRMYLYVFTPIVKMPFGEMQITLTTRAKTFYDARQNVVDELLSWKKAQEQARRNDFPWLDEAMKLVEACEGTHFMTSSLPDRVGVFWYDEREV
jgi:hypothetical protein